MIGAACNGSILLMILIFAHDISHPFLAKGWAKHATYLFGIGRTKSETIVLVYGTLHG